MIELLNNKKTPNSVKTGFIKATGVDLEINR